MYPKDVGSVPPGPKTTSIREFPIPSSITPERSATTTQQEVGAASRKVGGPIGDHPEEASKKLPDVAQPTHLVSPADFQLPKPHRDFEEEKNPIATRIEEVLR